MSQNQQDKEPTRDDVIAWYKEQIELAQLRATLAELQSKAVQEEAKRLQATLIIAQITHQHDNAEETDQGKQTPEV
jgi:hypothetical protein